MRAARRAALLTPLIVSLVAVALGGCDDGSDALPEAAPDGGVDPGPDRGADAAEPDAGGPRDAGRVDGGPSAPDVAPPDADPPEPDGEAVDPLTVPLAGQSQWGPAARVHRLDVPPDPETARRAGCLLHGAGAGSRMFNLLLLAGGGLGGQVRPDGAGHIALVLLMRARGWEPGLSAGELESLDIDVLIGAQGPDLELLYRPGAFVDGDPQGPPLTTFAETWVDEGWLESDRVTMAVPISLLDSPELPLVLDQTTLTGRVSAEGPGWRLTDGVMAGYVTTERMAILVEELRAGCVVDDPPTFCALIRSQLDNTTEELIALVVDIIGGLDARVDGPRAAPCDPEMEDGCNAIGICLLAQAEPVVVEGVAPPAEP